MAFTQDTFTHDVRKASSRRKLGVVSAGVVCDSGLYYVNYILNKHWLASTQAGSIGKTTRQEVEAGQWEQENSGKEEAYSSAVPVQTQKKQDVIASLKRVLSHVANIH